MTRSLLTTLALVLTAGCADPNAVEKCEDLVDAICAMVEDNCVPPMDQDECVEDSESVMDCDETIDIAGSYDDCMDDIESTDECLPSTGMPDSCDGVLLYAE